ncbi:MAG: ABC-2 type transport system ATP-binding protein [Roseivirga sp.]|jgi:ABC-2 type transport system ATP-binding protein
MISIKNLSFQYTKKKELFSGLNLQLSGGSIVGLLGKNGAGKTSLIKLISGLLYPTAGECSVLDYTPSQRSPHFLSDIYFLPEQVESADFRIEKYVKLYSPFYPSFSHELFKSHLQAFGLADTEKIKELSQGQRKAFYLSFGLATGCTLLLLDEPTNGLDIPSKSVFRKLIAASLTNDRLIIISTHQVRDLGNLIDRVVVLNDGDIVFNQSAESISTTYDFVSTSLVQDSTQWLYQERGLGNGKAIVKSKGETQSKIDLELLFSGIISHPEKFKITTHE